MSYTKAMKHHNNPRKWKMTPARKRGNQLIFGAPMTEKPKGLMATDKPETDTRTTERMR